METAEAIEAKTPPCGIGGWLVVLILGLFGSGVLNLINALSMSRSSPSTTEYIVMFFGLVLAALAFSAAVQLLRIKNQGITLAKIFLCSNLGVTALVVLGTFVQSTGGGSASAAAEDLGRALLFSMLWFLYLDQSVRVRNTFGITGKSKPLAAVETPPPVVLKAAPPLAVESAPPVILKTTRRSDTLKYVLIGVVALALVGVIGVRVARSSAEKQAAEAVAAKLQDLPNETEPADSATVESELAAERVALAKWAADNQSQPLAEMKTFAIMDMPSIEAARDHVMKAEKLAAIENQQTTNIPACQQYTSGLVDQEKEWVEIQIDRANLFINGDTTTVEGLREQATGLNAIEERMKANLAKTPGVFEKTYATCVEQAKAVGLTPP